MRTRPWILEGIRCSASREGAARGPTPEVVAAAIGVQPVDLVAIQVQRRSLDARARPPVYQFRLRLDVRAGATPQVAHGGGVRLDVAPAEEPRPGLPSVTAGCRPVVIGAGPAGLFAALDLARRGSPPLLLERGDRLGQRRAAVARFRREGRLDPDSNVVFGEGGAGTFSDGKVYTRARAPHGRDVLRDLVALGAPGDLLIAARPHIGTDRLARILPRLRDQLTELGVELRYRCGLQRLEIERGALVAVHTSDGERIVTEAAILATGHHARDTLAQLLRDGVPMESKPIALGVRIEHPQRQVDRWMYGQERRDALPAASYRFAIKPAAGRPRPVYSFCMCPGGVIVAAPEAEGVVVTNGMSGSRRSGRYANSGLVVPVGLEDYEGSGRDALSGVRFVRELEQRAFAAGGGGFAAPAQRAADFVADRPSQDLPPSTYRPTAVPCDLGALLPAAVVASLRSALQQLDRRWPGFAGPDAVLIGVESRTSSPVRLSRGQDGQSLGVRGLYPAGEGAGYAGGILSSASDGIEAARLFAASCRG